MKKYLIVECVELGDQWECDADRTPICVVDDYSKYSDGGYDIYKINSDGSLTLIQDYTKCKTYFAVCRWDDLDSLEEVDPDFVLRLEKIESRDDFTKEMCKTFKELYHFEDDVEEIYTDLIQTGEHAEEIDGQWVVIGEVIGKRYPLGY